MERACGGYEVIIGVKFGSGGWRYRQIGEVRDKTQIGCMLRYLVGFFHRYRDIGMREGRYDDRFASRISFTPSIGSYLQSIGVSHTVNPFAS